MTARELVEAMKRDPVLVAYHAAQDAYIAEERARHRADEKPLVDDLRKVGVSVESIWDLVNTSVPYPDAIPVLLSHLKRPYLPKTRDAIGRSLAVKEARYAFPILAEAFITEPNAEDALHQAPKNGLAAALAATVTPSTIDKLIELARNPANGESRFLLLRGLKRSRSPNAKKAIDELAHDPLFAVEIAASRRRKSKVP